MFDSVRHYIDPEDLARIDAIIAAADKDKPNFQTEVRITPPDGRDALVHLRRRR